MAGQGMSFTTVGWTGAQITWTHGTYGAATYTVSGDAQNPYAIYQALRDWLDDPARPWAAGVATVTLVIADAASGEHYFYFTFTGSDFNFTVIAPNATWLARAGNPGDSTPAPGTCTSIPGSTPWERWDVNPGERSRKGAWRAGHPAVSHRRPEVELGLSLEQAFALSKALRLAAQPRQAYLYDEGGATWRLVSVGRCDLRHPADDATVVIGTLDVLGGL